ncbi:MAG: triose-phosphate isomerase [Actinomycetota bacterium]
MASRMPIISGNWKMNLNHFEAIQLVQKLGYQLDKDDHANVEVTLHPSFTNIRSIQTLLDADGIPIRLGAQNCHWDDSGAWTGEVSATMLAKLQVRYVICGHSERRELLGETDEQVNGKIKAVFKHEMTPILAVGETQEERDADATEAKVVGQLEAALTGVGGGKVASMVIAYEPIWAIGTGLTATTADAQAVCALVRETVARLKGKEAAAGVRIQYGGSVKPTNIYDIMAQKDIDGALVGGASLEAESFARICQYRLQG